MQNVRTLASLVERNLTVPKVQTDIEKASTSIQQSDQFLSDPSNAPKIIERLLNKQLTIERLTDFLNTPSMHSNESKKEEVLKQTDLIDKIIKDLDKNLELPPTCPPSAKIEDFT